MTSQPDFVAGSSNGGHVEFFVPENGHKLNEHEELIDFGVLGSVGIASFEEVFNASVPLDISEVIVGVLAAAIDVVEGLLME